MKRTMKKIIAVIILAAFFVGLNALIALESLYLFLILWASGIAGVAIVWAFWQIIEDIDTSCKKR